MCSLVIDITVVGMPRETRKLYRFRANQVRIDGSELPLRD
jgi:hypothetical protein